MPAMKNARHEAFAQAVAKGRTQVEAYALAGYKPNDGHAARLAGNGRVRARIAELQGRAAERTAVTIESLTAELEEARALAKAQGQAGGAVAATMGKAKLHGLLVERRHHSGAVGSYDLSKLTDEELERLESILGPIADAGGDPSGEAEA
ncbi:terminase small subunit [Salinarimonas sp. NSM]|uniref:terminase small subunit n=1 Tax=Salinarimonas sp. NSM TaxID=3458003 RepID=UPI004037330F